MFTPASIIRTGRFPNDWLRARGFHQGNPQIYLPASLPYACEVTSTNAFAGTIRFYIWYPSP